MFDVNCHICTGSHESTLPSGLTNMPTSCQSAALPKDSDLLSDDVSKSDHSPRKKICLAQRLKMYSTEPQRSSISSKVDGKCITEMVSDADVIVANVVAPGSVKQDSGVHEIHSSYEPALEKPKLRTDASEWQTQTVQKLQNERSVEQRNSDEHKLEEMCSAVLHEEPQQDNVTSSHSHTAKQQVDRDTSEFAALQEAHFKKNHVTAGYESKLFVFVVINYL